MGLALAPYDELILFFFFFFVKLLISDMRFMSFWFLGNQLYTVAVLLLGNRLIMQLQECHSDIVIFMPQVFDSS
jgi:hypothetical protein